MIQIKKRYYALVAGIAMSACLSGCGDNTVQEKNIPTPQTAATATTPKIEVVANKDAKEIKVKAKAKSGDKNSSYYYDYNVKSEYDLKSQPANKDAAVKVRPRTKIDANLHIRSPYEHVEIELLVKRLSTTFRIKCSACHDDYANGIIGPSLLSRDSNYIYARSRSLKVVKNPILS